MDCLNLYVLTKQDYDLGWITDDNADREIWTYNNQEIQTLVDEPDQYWFFKKNISAWKSSVSMIRLGIMDYNYWKNMEKALLYLLPQTLQYGKLKCFISQ